MSIQLFWLGFSFDINYHKGVLVYVLLYQQRSSATVSCYSAEGKDYVRLYTVSFRNELLLFRSY